MYGRTRSIMAVPLTIRECRCNGMPLQHLINIRYILRLSCFNYMNVKKIYKINEELISSLN